MEKIFCDALIEKIEDCKREIGIIISKKRIDGLINSAMDACKVDASSIESVEVSCLKDDSGKITEVKLDITLFPSSDNLEGEYVSIFIDAPILKRKKINISGYYDNIEFSFSTELSSDFYMQFSHSITVHKDGKRYKLDGKRAHYDSVASYDKVFEKNLTGAKNFVNGLDYNNNPGTRGAVRKIRSERYSSR